MPPLTGLPPARGNAFLKFIVYCLLFFLKTTYPDQVNCQAKSGITGRPANESRGIACKLKRNKKKVYIKFSITGDRTIC